VLFFLHLAIYKRTSWRLHFGYKIDLGKKSLIRYLMQKKSIAYFDSHYYRRISMKKAFKSLSDISFFKDILAETKASL